MPKQYLEKSIIIVSNKYIKYLLNFIFKLTSPLATVYIYEIEKDKKTNEELINLIENNDLKLFKIINPN